MSRYPTLLNSNTFIQLPVDRFNDEDITLENVLRLVSLGDHTRALSYLQVASVIKKLLLSLKGATLSLFEVLKLWEIRILALVFVANVKIELPDGEVFQIQSVKYIKNEVDILIPELYKINKLRRQHDLSYTQKQKQVEQFPREVSDEFKFLLLRIRYGSSLILINEYYNHIWRSTKTIDQLRLNKIAYSIIAVLTARQEYLTLINLIDSILLNVVTNGDAYVDRLILVKTVISLIRLEKDKIPLSDDVQLQFAKLQNLGPLKELNKILNLVPPVYNDETSSPLTDEDIYGDKDLAECFQILQRQVEDLQITGRIVCTLSAKFNIDIKIDDGDDGKNNDDDDDNDDDKDQSIKSSLHKIKQDWSAHVTKYYGLE